MSLMRRYSLRQRLDLVSGVLLLLLGLGGTAALDMARRQRHDLRLLQAVYEQERAVAGLMVAGERALELRDDVLDVNDRLLQLHDNLRALRDGGTMALQDSTLPVAPVRDRFVRASLDGALAWLARHAPPRARTPEDVLAVQQAFAQDGGALLTHLEGMATAAIRRSQTDVMLISGVELALIFGGIALFLLWIVVIRGLLTTPLHRMAGGIEAMQRTGRLVKLPVPHENELGVVAQGFNELADHVEAQKQRLREHIVELQRMNLELDQMAHVKDEFLETVNHQLRTPLTAIVEGLSLLQDGAMGAVSQDQLQLLNAMDSSAEQLGRFIEGLLDLSRLVSGRRPLARAASDLTALLHRVHAAWQSRADGVAVRLQTSALPPVFMDQDAIRDVLEHVVRNAVRHAPRGTEVTITAQQVNSLVLVEVRDQGAGLTPEQLSQLFQPFTHVQTPDAPGSSGSGLGLSFCRQVIERHRGTITADSAPGRGTGIAFTVPVATPAFMLDDACRSAQEASEKEGVGVFALLLVAASVAGSLGELERLLRRNTHRGDVFLRLEDAVAIIAVTNGPGLGAMRQRLARVLDEAGIQAAFAAALSTEDGAGAEALLAAARRRLSEQLAALHATMPRRP